MDVILVSLSSEETSTDSDSDGSIPEFIYRYNSDIVLTMKGQIVTVQYRDLYLDTKIIQIAALTI